jgi:hypothetical protein
MSVEFSDEDMALMLEGVSRKLEAGHLNQAEVAVRLASLMQYLNGVTSYQGPVKSQGRVSFGRSSEGQVGTALFVRDAPSE